MFGKLYLAIFGALLLRSALGLRCQTGYEITSKLISKRKWTETECAPDESVCQKYQGKVLFSTIYRIQVDVGLCAKQSSCKANCTDEENNVLVTNFLAGLGLAKRSNVELLSCRRACCEKDNCNEKDIGEIIIAKEAVATLVPLMKEIVSTRANPTTTAPTTTLSHVTSATTVVTTSLGNSNSNLTVSVDDIFECIEGFEISDDFQNTSSWNTTLCNRSLQQKCIRAEGTVVVSQNIEISTVTSYCTSQNLCEEPCNVLMMTSVPGLESLTVNFEASSCRQACCDSNHCNNQTVDQIESRLIEPSTIVSTIQTNLQETILPSENPDFIECSSGYEIISKYWNVLNFTTTFCRKSLGQKCSRAEGVVLVSRILPTKMVRTFCGRENETGNSCDELFTSALIQIDPAFIDSSVLSCNRTSCDTENCNNNTIAQIESEKPKLTTMLSTTEITTISTTSNSNTIHCTTGYKIQSTLLNDELWNVSTCESPTQSCIRSEIVASIFDSSEVLLQIATCVDLSVCKQTCEELTRNVLFSPGTSSNSEIENLDLDLIDLRTCNFVCCKTENCNNDSIANITGELGTFPPVLLSVEINVAETLECYSGYIVQSNLFNYNNWSLIQCPESAQKCVRANARGTLFGVAIANATVGFCATNSQCDNQVCNNFSELLATDLETFENIRLTMNQFQINSCHSTCCNTSGCYNQLVSSTVGTPPVTTPLSKFDSDGTASPLPLVPSSTLAPAFDSQATPSQSQKDCPKPINYFACQHQSCNFGHDEDTLFMLSLVPSLRNFPPRIASEVKMRFFETMHQAQFGNLSIR